VLLEPINWLNLPFKAVFGPSVLLKHIPMKTTLRSRQNRSFVITQDYVFNFENVIPSNHPITNMALLKTELLKLIPNNAHQWVEGLTTVDISNILYQSFTSTQLVKASATIGQDGERVLEEMLTRDFTVLNTAKTGKTGDFIILVNGIRILIEVKKYSKTVPSAEIKKFYRDLQANSSVRGGLFISLTSRIAGISKIIQYSDTSISGTRIPIVFVSLDNITTIAEVIKACIEIIQIDVQCQSRHIHVEDEINNSVNELHANLDCISRCRMLVDEASVSMNKHFRGITQSILCAEIKIKQCIDNIRKRVEVSIAESNLDDVKVVLAQTETDEKICNMIEVITPQLGQYHIVKNIIIGEKCSIKVCKSKATVTLAMDLVKMGSFIEKADGIPGSWSYSRNKLTIEVIEASLQCILGLLRDY
jgi:hypothetical protein